MTVALMLIVTLFPIEISSGREVSRITSVPMKTSRPMSTPRRRCRRGRVVIDPGAYSASTCSSRTTSARPTSGTRARFVPKHALEFADVGEARELVLAELNPELLLDRVHEVHVRQRVPARHVRRRRVVVQHQTVGVEGITRDALQPVVEIVQGAGTLWM